MSEINYHVQPTPNPNALKFIFDQQLKIGNYVSYKTPVECGENNLAINLFTVRGIDQLHFFENTLTITKFNYETWDEIEPKLKQVFDEFIPKHNPDYEEYDPEAERRANLTPELKVIEEVLDRTIRPGLQADGGDVQAISLEDDVLLVRYQGACGTCPSSTTGTLEAIKSILRNEYKPEIDVYIAPEW